MRALIHFDGHVRKSGEILEPLLVGRRRPRRIGNDRHDHCGMAGADAARDADRPAGRRRSRCARGCAAPAPDRAPCRASTPPAERTRPTDQDRITSMPTSPTSGSMKFKPNAQAADRPAIARHRGQRVGEHVHVSGAVVQILLMPGVTVRMTSCVMRRADQWSSWSPWSMRMMALPWPGMAVRVVMAFAQQPGAREVHAQAERGDRHRLAKVDVDGMQEPQHRLRSRCRARSWRG